MALSRAEVERQAFVQRMRELRMDIEQIFIDAASWNENSTARKNGAEAINPDPDGELRRMADGLDRSIAREEKRLANRAKA